jgi:hypothetical protein
VADLAIKAYEQAYEPKKLVLLPGGISTPMWRSSIRRVSQLVNGSPSTS